MRAITVMTVLLVVNAAALALNVYFAITTGSAISWAASVFIGVMLLLQLVTYAKARW